MKIKKNTANIVLLSVLLTVGFGCKAITSKFQSGAVSESIDPKEVIMSANKKLQDKKFFHSVIKSKTGQTNLETEIDFNAPDRLFITNKLPNGKTDVIAIGNESYTRFNDGKWSKMANSIPVGEMRGKMSEESVAALKDFEFAGKENVNGKDALVYKFKSTYNGESSSKMWIAVETGLPVKIDTEGSYSGTNVQTSVTYDYDTEKKIEAPAGVTDKAP